MIIWAIPALHAAYGFFIEFPEGLCTMHGRGDGFIIMPYESKSSAAGACGILVSNRMVIPFLGSRSAGYIVVHFRMHRLSIRMAH